MIFFLLCPSISLSMTVSRSIHVAANGFISFCLWLSNIPLGICTTTSSPIPLSMDTQVASTSWLLQTVLQWTRVHASFRIVFFSGWMPRSGTAGKHGSSVFSVLRNLQAILHSGYTNLHSHKLCKRVLFSPHHLSILLFIDFLMMAILTSVKSCKPMADSYQYMAKNTQIL